MNSQIHITLAWLIFTLILSIPGMAATQYNQGQTAECIYYPTAEKISQDTYPDMKGLPWPVEKEKLLLENIEIIRLNIFNMDNPKENNQLYHLANDLHIITRKKVILDRILVQPDSLITQQQLEESERLLRNLGFLFEAKIIISKLCQNSVAIKIITHDGWSFFPNLSYSKTGGKSKSEIGFTDKNIAGTGKSLSINRTKEVARTGYTLEYFDPNLFHSDYQLGLALADNDDGEEQTININKPFISLNTQTAYGIYLQSAKRIDTHYWRGDESLEFNHDIKFNKLFWGVSEGIKNNEVTRWTIGLTTEEHIFSKITEFIPQNKSLQLNDRFFNYPWIGYQYIQDAYIQKNQINSMIYTEDIYAGKSYSASIGYDKNYLPFYFNYQNTFYNTNKTLFLYNLNLNGFYDQDNKKVFDLHSSFNTQYFYKLSEQSSFYSKLAIEYTKNKPEDKQLLLGGENGLRGYPLFYQTGDRKFTFTIERRYYFEKHFLNLFYLGAAAYVDIGRSWYKDQDNGMNGGLLKNVGIGLRILPSVAGRRKIIHIDAAYPINKDDEKLDSIQWNISVKSTF